MSICVGDHILQEFNTLFLTRFMTYKIVTPNKNIGREGADKHLPQSPFTESIFLENDIWHCFLSI